jgi:hypothetical protein
VDSGAIRNYVLLLVVIRLGLPHREKEKPYPLVIISGDLILYKDGIIRLETGPVEIEIKGRKVTISFNILLLGKDKIVLGMLFLKEFNLKIN